MFLRAVLYNSVYDYSHGRNPSFAGELGQSDALLSAHMAMEGLEVDYGGSGGQYRTSVGPQLANEVRLDRICAVVELVRHCECAGRDALPD